MDSKRRVKNLERMLQALREHEDIRTQEATPVFAKKELVQKKTLLQRVQDRIDKKLLKIEFEIRVCDLCINPDDVDAAKYVSAADRFWNTQPDYLTTIENIKRRIRDGKSRNI